MKYTPKAQLTEGSIGPMLVRLTIPMVFGVLGMVIFNLVDTFFVGQLGTIELAAMSFTFPVALIVGSMAMGLGIGTSAVISRAIGEGDSERVQRLTTDALLLAVLVGVLFGLLGILTIEPVFRLMGATDDIMPFIRQYMLLYYVGVMFMVVPMVGNNTLRATGDTKTPAIIMIVAVIINLVLDPLLIFGIGPFPRLELAGAALTTVIARIASFSMVLGVLHFREHMLTFVRPRLSTVINSWKDILYIGLPTGATNVITPLAMGVLTRLIATYGAAAVAGFGAATRIDLLAMIVLMALSTVLAPFVGQNWGAGLKERVDTAITYSLAFTLGWGALMYLLFLASGTPVASLFNDNPNVIAVMTLYLSIVPLGYGLQGTVSLTNSVLNVLQKPLHAAALTIGQMFGLLVPFAYVGSYLWGLSGIFSGMVIAHCIAAVVAYFVLRHVLGTVQWEQSEQSQPVATGMV